MAAAGEPPPPSEPDKLWLWNEPIDVVFDLIGAAIVAWVVRWLLYGGEVDQAMFPLLITGCFGVGVLFRYVDLRRRRSLARRSHERDILRLAEANQGVVTPALAASKLPHLGLNEAKAWLDQLVKAGLCGLDSDRVGNLVYRFPFGSEDDADERPWQHLAGDEATGVDVEA